MDQQREKVLETFLRAKGSKNIRFCPFHNVRALLCSFGISSIATNFPFISFLPFLFFSYLCRLPWCAAHFSWFLWFCSIFSDASRLPSQRNLLIETNLCVCVDWWKCLKVIINLSIYSYNMLCIIFLCRFVSTRASSTLGNRVPIFFIFYLSRVQSSHILCWL